MNFFFFGDSICFGQGVSPHKTWVSRISQKIESNLPRSSIVTVNTSINGNTTRMALERMAHDVTSHGVFGILVQFGMNDCNYWLTDKGQPRVTPSAFKANLNEILDRSLIAGAQCMFLNTNHPTPRTNKFDCCDLSYQESNRKYNGLIRQVAASRSDVQLIDLEEVWISKLTSGKATLQDLILPDGIHLHARGHDVYFDIIAPQILTKLETLIERN